MFSQRFNQLKKVWMNIIITVITVMIILPLTFSFGPILETKYFPVVSNLVITAVSDKTSQDGYIELYGHIDKNRTCEYQGANWYAGEPNRDFTRIYTKRSTEDINSPTGTRYFGPLKLGINESLQRYNYKIFLVAEYDCHPGWKSLSILGPIDLSKIYKDTKELSSN